MMAIRSVRLQTLAETLCAPKFRERVTSIVEAYRGPPSEWPPPIPIRMNLHGQILLNRGGNHRLQAAREAKLAVVLVNIDDRDVARLVAIDEAAARRKP
jgi:hypothetical protein